MSNNYNMPVVLASLAAGEQPLSYLDQDYDSVARMGTLACTATGTNTIALSSVLGYPTMIGYGNNQKIAFTPVNTTTGDVTINVNSLGALKAYLNDGTTRVTANDLIAGRYYEFAYNSALDSLAGGWQLCTPRVGIWVAYTPVVSSGTGSIGAASATGKYTRIGSTLFFEATITVTNAGTAGAELVFTLPSVPVASGTWWASGRDNNTGLFIGGTINASTNTVGYTKYDGTFLATLNSPMTLTGFYESA